MHKPGLRDALPQPQSADTRTDPFWNNLDSNLSTAVASTSLAVPQRNLDVGFGDVARGVGAGALDLVSGISELARQASDFGKENVGKQGGDYLEQARANMASKLSPVLDAVASVGEVAKSGAETLTEGMSGDAKEALNRTLVGETSEGRLTWGDGAGDVDVWAMKMAQGIGSLVPTLLAGGVTGVAAKASIGRAVTASMLKRGATQEIAEAVAAKTVSKLATGAAVTTGATGSVGSAGVNTREIVLNMSFDELAASTTFREAFTRIDRDQQNQHLSDQDKLGLARQETANVASRATMSDAKTWGAAAMGSMMGDAMLFKMLAGKMAAGGILKGAAKGAAGEGIGETLEEGVQQYAVNSALNEVAGANIEPMQGVLSSALEGGLIGMGTGGVVGSVGGARGQSSQVTGTADVESASDIDSSPASSGEPVQAEPVTTQVAPDPTAAADTHVEPEMPMDRAPLGPSASQFDELRDVPAYLRQDDTVERFRGMAPGSEVQDALAGPSAPTVDELLLEASTQQLAQNGNPAAATEVSVSPYEAEIGELKTLRITRQGKPFASEKEAAMASRKGKEIPVKLKGGGFGVAEQAEVEQVNARSNEPSTAEHISQNEDGELATLAPPIPTSVRQQSDDQTLTTPATDAGVVVSEVTKHEQAEGAEVDTSGGIKRGEEANGDHEDGYIGDRLAGNAVHVVGNVGPKQATVDGDKSTKHLTPKEVELVTLEWFKQYQGAAQVAVKVHGTQRELEQALGLQAQHGLIRRAAFDDGNKTLHIAAETIGSVKRMRELLRHEVLAHYGLANVLGAGEYTKLISRLIRSKQEPSMKAVWEWVEEHYAGEDVGTQAEEVLAHLAELEPSAWRKGWDTVVVWVTKALRAVGLLPDGITAAETRAVIQGLGKKLHQPGLQAEEARAEHLHFSAERSPWSIDFPEVILHGRLADATSHPDYVAAKGGDDEAARRLVSNVLSPDAIRQLKKIIGGREAIALGVHAEEVVSRNAIPSAMADVLGKVLGIEIDLDIIQTAKVGRTAQDGFGRLANQPVFAGPVRVDKPYIIMDDTLTQGGTLANLKGYIENRGGEVLAATALTGKQYSAKIAIDRSTIKQLRDQYDGTGLEAWWQNRFGYGFDSLTESEGRYLLRAKDADKIRDRVTSAGPQTPARSEHESARNDGSLPPDGLKFSQSLSHADKVLQKLNLGPQPDIIDHAKEQLNKLRQVERGVVSSWIDSIIKKANTELLDALAPIKYAEQAAGFTEAEDSGYIAARLATGAASTMQATLLYGLPQWKDGVIQRKAGTNEHDALLGIFSDLGVDLHNWLGWMAGHRAEVLMRQGRENLLDANDIAVLKGLDKGKTAKFQDAKARWNRLNAATLDLAQEAGLFSREARAEFEHEWYVPFFRVNEEGDVMAPFKAKGIANQVAGIKKLKGGKANTNDLLENIFTSTSKLIDASMKNMAAQKTVWNLADTGVLDVIAKPNKMDWRALKNGKNLIALKLDGEDYMIRVNDPALYRAMTFFDRQPFGPMVNVAAKAKRLLTASVTASPEFMLRNFLRDSLSSWTISKDGFQPILDSIRGLRKTFAMKGSTIDVMFSGASFLGGYVNGNDPGAMADVVRKSLRRKGLTPEQIAKYEKSIIRNAAHAKGIVADVWEKYSRYGEALENANREAVYDAAIKAGKSHALAAFESKDLMDFSMLGASRMIQGAAMVLPFFNARIQGLGKLSRELRDNPAEIAKRAGMITAMSLGLLAINWDDERYEGLQDWDKDSYWHFFVGEHHWRLPKPFEIGVLFGTIPERIVRALKDRDSGAQFGKAVARAFADTFALDPTPQLVKPIVEAAFNYDTFKGESIDGPQDLLVQAPARYSEQTSLLMRELGALSGLSPKQLEHLLIGYTGTLGGYVMAAADGLIRLSRPGESASWRADEIPFIKAVYRGTGPAKSTQHMEDFYQLLNEVNQLKRTIDRYRREKLDDKADKLLQEQGGILRSRQSLSRTQRQLRVLRNKIELLQRDRLLGAAEKRRRIDELLSQRNNLVQQAVSKNRLQWE